MEQQTPSGVQGSRGQIKRKEAGTNRVGGIIVGVPALNEEKHIAKVLVTAQKYCDGIIVCDDGSLDMTGEISAKLGAKVLRHERALGYGSALLNIFREANANGAEILVTMDGDGQHDGDEIPELIEPILQGKADIVVGSRFASGNGSVKSYRKAGIKMITAMTNEVTDYKISDAQSGFRAYNKAALRVIRPREMGMGASVEILTQAKSNDLRLAEVPIHISYGEDTSTHNPLYHGVDVVMAAFKQLSIQHPLIIYGIPGLAILLTGIGFGVWTAESYNASHSVPTNLALYSIGGVSVGLLLAITGLILWVIISVVREGR